MLGQKYVAGVRGRRPAHSEGGRVRGQETIAQRDILQGQEGAGSGDHRTARGVGGAGVRGRRPAHSEHSEAGEENNTWF
jgi:hypothetical protein